MSDEPFNMDLNGKIKFAGAVAMGMNQKAGGNAPKVPTSGFGKGLSASVPKSVGAGDTPSGESF